MCRSRSVAQLTSELGDSPAPQAWPLSSANRMKCRWILGLALALAACGKNGQTSNAGGSSSSTTAGVGGMGGATASGGTAGAGFRSSGGGTRSDQGGAPAAGNASGGSAGMPTRTSASVLERNGGPTRESHWVQPTLTKATAAKMTLDADFRATFQGNMYASPLYIEHGPGGKGAFIAVSTDNVVTAL